LTCSEVHCMFSVIQTFRGTRADRNPNLGRLERGSHRSTRNFSGRSGRNLFESGAGPPTGPSWDLRGTWPDCRGARTHRLPGAQGTSPGHLLPGYRQANELS
jgi:hypothetical protein